ncbi:mitochondrial fission factor-like [Amphiura filiformis]|uniref:mitochondrial fission factor-like n=1 Tax=Amphiura filiformis TaxID=82378 RepID=UPI003B220441
MGSSERTNILTQMEQEMDELTQIRYTAEYSAAINSKMQVPERLSMGPEDEPLSGLMTPPDDSEELIANSPAHAMMNVPDRIIIGGSNSHLGLRQGPRQMNLDDMAQFPSASDTQLGLSTPPHTLTLEEYNFPMAGNQTINEEGDTPKRGSNTSGGLARNDSLPALGSLDSASALDIQAIQRHINLLNRKVALLEHENRNREWDVYYIVAAYVGLKCVQFIWNKLS